MQLIKVDDQSKVVGGSRGLPVVLSIRPDRNKVYFAQFGQNHGLHIELKHWDEGSHESWQIPPEGLKATYLGKDELIELRDYLNKAIENMG